MRTLQELFNLAIEQGSYCPANPFMCNALGFMHEAGKLTLEEREYALAEIKKYIRANSTLQGAISDHNEEAEDKGEPTVPNFWDGTLAIYADWDKRPKLYKGYWQA